MAISVTNESELDTALHNNYDDIILENDITITTHNERVFSHKIDGNGKTLTLNVTQFSSHHRWLTNFSGELYNLKVTGNLALASVSSSTALSCFILMKSGGYVHNVVIDNLTFTGNFTSNAMWALFSNADSSGAVLEDIWLNKLAYSNGLTYTGRVFIIGNNVNTNRISISNITSMYPVCPAASIITNGYLYDCHVIKQPVINGAAFRAKSNSGRLYVNTNCSFASGSLTESDENGRFNNSPDWNDLGFSEKNKWITKDGYPSLALDEVITIEVTGSKTVALNNESEFTASDSTGEITNYSWDMGDGTVIETGGTSVIHTYKEAGVYTVTASSGGFSGTYETRVITVDVKGDLHFANSVEHTIEAVGTLPNEGEYQWSDTHTGAVHTAVYTGYGDGDEKRISVTYTVDRVNVTKYVTLICVNGTLELYVDKEHPNLNDTISIFSSYSGSETPSNQTLIHMTESTEEELKPYWSPFEYTFNDEEETTHYFVYKTVTPIEGEISKTITVTTQNKGVKITSPPNNSNIFVNSDVTFTAMCIGITNPSYLWSDGHTTESFTTKITTEGTQNMSLTVTADEGTFEDSVLIKIIPSPYFTISAPSSFSNGVPVTFKVVTDLNPEVTWSFPDGTSMTGITVSKTFTGYHDKERISVTANAVFTDDIGNTRGVLRSVYLSCISSRSYYMNARGERFVFDDSCRILREGKSGFSEIQINTDVFTGHDYNAVSGLSINNRAITFNVFVKGKYEVMHAKRREMVHVMAPSKELGVFSYTRDDGQIFTMKCNIALGYPIFTNEAERGGWVGTLSFIAPNGIWEGEEISASTSSSIENTGDVPCGFSAVLEDNLVNATNSETMQASSGNLSGYKVDTAKGTVLKLDGDEWVNGWGDISLNSTLVNLEVGNNTITGCSSITFKPLYLGV